MPANNFLEVATDPGANVETQVAYAADPVRTVSYAAGEIPDANVHGKMFRQSSVIAAMVAQAICDLTGDDMLDNGISATQLASFKKMLQQAGLSQYIADTGAANVLVITPVPAISAYASGQRFLIKPANANTGASTVNVNGLGAKSIVLSNGDALRPGDIPAAGLIEVIYQATLGKFVLTAPGTPAYSTSASGYMRIPGTPFILQWVAGTSPSGAGSAVDVPTGMGWYNLGTVSFPVSFPSACLWFDGSVTTVVADNYLATFLGSKGAAGIGNTFLVRSLGGANGALPYVIFAIGL